MPLKVNTYLKRNLRWGALHFTLLDPEKLDPARAARVARAAEDAGSHAILVGGSTGVGGKVLDDTVRAIKATCGIPVILFPGSADGISPHADAVLFLSMLNSDHPRFLVGEQLAAVDRIAEAGLEAIPMGYVIVEPGGRVGEVGRARLLKRSDIEGAIRYGLLAQYFGMDYIYLEAGSGAAEPVPAEMIRSVKRRCRIPVIVGGGIRSASAARAMVDAGADIFVTGNLLEAEVDVRRALGAILRDSIEQIKERLKWGP